MPRTATLNFSFNQTDLLIMQNYLDEKRKSSDRTYYQAKSRLYHCLNYVGKPLLEIKLKDIRDYLRLIDSKNYKYTSKMSIRSRLQSFFEYVEYEFECEEIEYRNPVPPNSKFKFTQNEADFKTKKFEDTIFSNQELLYILDHSKKRRLRDFIFFGILICTGMRVSECLTIKLENINISERKIKTGYVKNAKKSKKELSFFIPEKFTKYLEFYTSHLKNTIWLFPGRELINHWLYPGAFVLVKRNYPQKYHQFHRFRATIISNRMVSLECPEWISEGLTNHKISSTTQREYYIKLSDSNKLKLYDKYFPYHSFPYF